MNNYKKISIVNEFNEESNEWEIKTVVIFRNDNSPIIENYDADKHLPMINELLDSNGFDFLNNGLSEALENGFVSIISKNNPQDMSILSSEIIQEQIKYSAKEDNKEEVAEELQEEMTEEVKTNTLELDEEDRGLAEYFRLAMLRDNRQLPPVGLAEIERLASVNERVAALEEAGRRLKDGRLSQSEYDRIYTTYRSQLAEAIKNLASKEEEKEVVAEINERTPLSEDDLKTFDAMMEIIDLCRDARVDDEKFEVVIDRGLTDSSKREVRISLLNGLSRDSYSFEFVEGEVFDQYLNDVIKQVSLNDGIVDVKTTPTELVERTNNSISLFTTKEGNQVLVRYNVPAMDLVENDVELNEVKDEIENSIDDVESNENSEELVPVVKNRINLNEEDRQLADYFRLAILRDNKQLPPVGLAEIERLASVNERVAALEEAHNRLNEGKLSLDEYNRIRDFYRAELTNAIKNSSINAPVVETAKENEQVYKKRLALSKEDRELADYLRKRILRDNGQLPPVGVAEIDRLANINERVAALEEAIKNLNEGKITKDDLDKMHANYRAQLADAIKEAAKNNRYENVDEVRNSKDNEKNQTTVVEQVNNVSNEDFEEARNEDVDFDNNVVDFTPMENKKEERVPFVPSPVIPLPSNYNEDEENENEMVQNDGAVDADYVVIDEDKNDIDKVEKEDNNVVVAPVVVPTVKNEEKEPSKSYFDIESRKKPTIDPSKPVQTKGKIVITPDGDREVIPSKGKVTKTNKLKQLGKYLLAGIAGVGAFLGINKLVDHFKDKFQHNQVQNGQMNTIKNSKELINFIMNYGNSYNVPAATMNFLMEDRVTNFLAQYKNADQLSEVLSALCYGYEANVLTTKDGNFRLAEDGNTYLRSFTNDFLCAKVVVNGYSPEQMLAVFGNTDMSYEQVMDGFKGYLNTVSLYGTTAVEPLPFRYLTNNDAKSTEALNNLFNKLSVVNANRKAGTLNSLHTDAFIVAVDELFVQNDQSLGLSEGTKMVAAALVDAYCYSQAQVANGEALYLHADYGLAKAGLNLQAVDGHFAIVSRDGTAYHFTNLLDVINYGYGDMSAVDSRCLTEQQILLENITQMNNLSSINEKTARITLANVLYQNGMKDYADMVANGNVSESLLQQIENINPGLADEIDDYEAAVKANTSTYIPFKVTVDGVDELLGIKGLTNDLATLHNIRRNKLYLYDKYEVYGQWYTVGGYYGYGYGGFSVPGPKVTVTKKTEKVSYDDLTDDEKKEVKEQIEQMQEEEEEEHKEQLEKAEEGKDALRDAVKDGATQEELEEIGSQYGIDVDDDYQENMSSALQQQEQGEQLASKIDEENERRNEEARRAAEERARREAEEQAQRKAEQEALISGSSSTTPSKDPQVDSDRVDTDAGEEPYVGDLTSAELVSMRDALTTAVAVEDLGLDEVPGRSLVKSRNA